MWCTRGGTGRRASFASRRSSPSSPTYGARRVLPGSEVEQGAVQVRAPAPRKGCFGAIDLIQGAGFLPAQMKMKRPNKTKMKRPEVGNEVPEKPMQCPRRQRAGGPWPVGYPPPPSTLSVAHQTKIKNSSKYFFRFSRQKGRRSSRSVEAGLGLEAIEGGRGCTTPSLLGFALLLLLLLLLLGVHLLALDMLVGTLHLEEGARKMDE